MSEAPEQQPGEAPRAGDDSHLGADVAALAHAARRLIADAAELASLEGRRAVVALMAMLTLAVTVAMLLVAAWLLLQGSIAVWLQSLGYPWASTLGALAAANGAAAAVLWWRLQRESRRLTFPATRQALTSERVDD